MANSRPGRAEGAPPSARHHAPPPREPAWRFRPPARFRRAPIRYVRQRRVAAALPSPGAHRNAERHPASPDDRARSEEHTSELQSLMRISYAVFCLKKKKKHNYNQIQGRQQQVEIPLVQSYMKNEQIE